MPANLVYENTLAFARSMDKEDRLRGFRGHFFIPKKNDKPVIYFCGNSLGLQPKSVRMYVEQELYDWERFGVDGHFEATHPWKYYHHIFPHQEARIVGAKPEEVVMMNALTVNLHLLMVSFYRPTKERYKIMVEGHLFPSDHYAVESQLQHHGFDPKEGIIELKPRKGEHTLRTEDILESIQAHKNDLALIMLGGVNYYTGQLFDLPTITEAGHEVGAIVGYDLAHAAGNVVLNLHEWKVDFAAWCTYKYLNSGPGSVGGAFIHERHANNTKLPRFAGWWGYEEESRFEMKKGFKAMKGAGGWQLSNAPVLNMVAHKASLDIFDQVGMDMLRMKSEQLTGYLEFLLDHYNEKKDLGMRIITPRDPLQRGCQLSLLTGKDGRETYDRISEAGVVADWRHPNVIRVAPVPLYNSFEDVYRFAKILAGSD